MYCVFALRPRLIGDEAANHVQRCCRLILRDQMACSQYIDKSEIVECARISSHIIVHAPHHTMPRRLSASWLSPSAEDDTHRGARANPSAPCQESFASQAASACPRQHDHMSARCDWVHNYERTALQKHGSRWPW